VYTFNIGTVKVTSFSATMQVFSPHDWLDNTYAGSWRNVEVTQDFIDGSRMEIAKGDRLIQSKYPRLLDVPVGSVVDLVSHLEKIYDATDRFSRAMRVTGYEWGELVEINWSSVGFAPGGTSYFLLPHDLPCVDLRCLQLDWGSVTVQLEWQRNHA
jgi:hypothetical protein